MPESDLRVTISREMLNEWQNLLDIMASKYAIPAALIMKIEMPNISVFLASRSENNPYKPGDSEGLMGSGLYCEQVIKTKSRLRIPNALKDAEWKNNPDIKLGMIAYIGFPILYPNGDVFGTICMLDSKENSFEGESARAVERFSKYIESYLDLKTSRALEGDQKEVFDKEVRCDDLLREVEATLQVD